MMIRSCCEPMELALMGGRVAWNTGTGPCIFIYDSVGGDMPVCQIIYCPWCGRKIVADVQEDD